MFRWLFTCTNNERKTLYRTIRRYKETVAMVEKSAALSSLAAVEDHDRMTKALIDVLDDMGRIVHAETIDEARKIAIDRTEAVRDMMIDILDAHRQKHCIVKEMTRPT